MEVILIRHTSVNVPKGMCYGQTDVELNSSFEEEATITKEKLNQYLPFDHVYSSPLTRCIKLATFCGYPDAEIDNRILEINLGEWEMQYYDQIRDPRLQEWYADYLNVRATGGESFKMQFTRVSHFLDELKARSFNRVAVFAHGGVLACAQVYSGCISYHAAFDSLIPFGGVIKINI